MIPEDDPRWTSLTAGYRLPYDARPVLRKIKADASDAAAWQELWNELHHQGDVGEASYLAVAALRRCSTATHCRAHLRVGGVACALDDLKTNADPDAVSSP